MSYSLNSYVGDSTGGYDRGYEGGYYVGALTIQLSFSTCATTNLEVCFSNQP